MLGKKTQKADTQEGEATTAPRRRSISRTLTQLLVLTVTAVSLTTATIIYFALSRSEHNQLEEKATRFINSIDDVLETHLWNMNYTTIEKIAQAYTNDELFEEFRILDDLGNVCFDFKRNRQATVIRRSADIYHNDQRVGQIEIAFTTDGLLHNNIGILLVGVCILFLVGMALSVVTGLFLNSILEKLFHGLNRIADAYATGETISPISELPYEEFQPLIHILGNMRDKLNDQYRDLEQAEKKYRSIFENAVEGLYQSTPAGRLLDANPAFARMLGYESAEIMTRTIIDAGKELYIDPKQREEYLRLSREHEVVSNFQVQLRRADGNPVWLSLHSRPVYDSEGTLVLIEGVAKDITQQIAAEKEKKELMKQLHHSQKLESVGRLAGGVAHDFNNMLSIILGYADMILQDLSSDDTKYGQMLEIRSAARRSSSLTRQLLAFARKQTVSPEILDLNETVPSMLKMLQRLLREDIHLTFSPGRDLWKVNLDPTQVDQILANLCINARDAIRDTGEIAITTESIYLDATYCRQHPDATPGAYVMLSVSDNGCGMDETVRNNIFEPFFTTKGITEGTGLGLSMVYGIVKQNRGSIHVYSEPEKGTVFKIYFPAEQVAAFEPQPPADTQDSSMGNETVLLVEDERPLLLLGQQTLQQLGYTVFATDSPKDALRIAAEHKETIQLLMTDVIMPEMNGRELAGLIMQECPGLKCLFVSGYTTEVIAPQGVLKKGVAFLQKPYTKDVLARKLREVLNSDSES